MTNSPGKNNAIVKAQPQQLAVRHEWLVERGINSLPILGITESRVMEFCSILNMAIKEESDVLNCMRTLKTIVDIGTHIRSCRRHLDSLIFPLVENFYSFFDISERERRANGREPHPRVYKYLELTFAALEALIGPLMSPVEAIMDVLFYGTTASRIRAIDWLLGNRQRLTTATHDLFSDYLRTMLLSTAQSTPLLFALKYADAEINDHIDEAIYFFIDKIILENIPPDELKEKVGCYVYSLSYNEKASQEAVIYALGKLAELGDPTYVECACEMFFVIAEKYRDLDRYSDDELEMISCVYKQCMKTHFARFSSYGHEMYEYKELVMEELKRRGLHG